jgi:TPR repeat protein
MYRLGCAILTGDWGLEKDLEAGVNWIKRSADEATKEYSKGKYGYAILFEKGIENIIPKDHDKMLSLLEEACKLGNPEARNFNI